MPPRKSTAATAAAAAVGAVGAAGTAGSGGSGTIFSATGLNELRAIILSAQHNETSDDDASSSAATAAVNALEGLAASKPARIAKLQGEIVSVLASAVDSSLPITVRQAGINAFCEVWKHVKDRTPEVFAQLTEQLVPQVAELYADTETAMCAILGCTEGSSDGSSDGDEFSVQRPWSDDIEYVAQCLAIQKSCVHVILAASNMFAEMCMSSQRRVAFCRFMAPPPHAAGRSNSSNNSNSNNSNSSKHHSPFRVLLDTTFGTAGHAMRKDTALVKRLLAKVQQYPQQSGKVRVEQESLMKLGFEALQQVVSALSDRLPKDDVVSGNTSAEAISVLTVLFNQLLRLSEEFSSEPQTLNFTLKYALKLAVGYKESPSFIVGIDLTRCIKFLCNGAKSFISGILPMDMVQRAYADAPKVKPEEPSESVAPEASKRNLLMSRFYSHHLSAFMGYYAPLIYSNSPAVAASAPISSADRSDIISTLADHISWMHTVTFAPVLDVIFSSGSQTPGKIRDEVVTTFEPSVYHILAAVVNGCSTDPQDAGMIACAAIGHCAELDSNSNMPTDRMDAARWLQSITQLLICIPVEILGDSLAIALVSQALRAIQTLSPLMSATACADEGFAWIMSRLVAVIAELFVQSGESLFQKLELLFISKLLGTDGGWSLNQSAFIVDVWSAAAVHFADQTLTGHITIIMDLLVRIGVKLPPLVADQFARLLDSLMRVGGSDLCGVIAGLLYTEISAFTPKDDVSSNSVSDSQAPAKSVQETAAYLVFTRHLPSACLTAPGPPSELALAITQALVDVLRRMATDYHNNTQEQSATLRTAASVILPTLANIASQLRAGNGNIPLNALEAHYPDAVGMLREAAFISADLLSNVADRMASNGVSSATCEQRVLASFIAFLGQMLPLLPVNSTLRLLDCASSILHLYQHHKTPVSFDMMAALSRLIGSCGALNIDSQQGVNAMKSSLSSIASGILCIASTSAYTKWLARHIALTELMVFSTTTPYRDIIPDLIPGDSYDAVSTIVSRQIEELSSAAAGSTNDSMSALASWFEQSSLVDISNSNDVTMTAIKEAVPKPASPSSPSPQPPQQQQQQQQQQQYQSQRRSSSVSTDVIEIDGDDGDVIHTGLMRKISDLRAIVDNWSNHSSSLSASSASEAASALHTLANSIKSNIQPS